MVIRKYSILVLLVGSYASYETEYVYFQNSFYYKVYWTCLFIWLA